MVLFTSLWTRAYTRAVVGLPGHACALSITCAPDRRQVQGSGQVRANPNPNPNPRYRSQSGGGGRVRAYTCEIVGQFPRVHRSLFPPPSTITDKTEMQTRKHQPKNTCHTHRSLRGIVSRYQFPFPPNFGFRPLTLTGESHFGPTCATNLDETPV